jgi:signal transduction histidine kinase
MQTRTRSIVIDALAAPLAAEARSHSDTGNITTTIPPRTATVAKMLAYLQFTHGWPGSMATVQLCTRGHVMHELRALHPQTATSDALHARSVGSAHDSDRGWRILSDAMTEGAALVTVDGTICLHNRRFGELATGSGDDSLVGVRLGQLLAESCAVSVEIPALLTAPVDGALARRDGSTIAVRIAARAVSLPDLCAWCVVITDLTEQRRDDSLYREALLAIEARERMIAIAGHELRGPLQTLLLRLDDLLYVDRGLCAGALAQLQAIRGRVKVLSTLVNTLLDVGRIGSGQLELDRRPTDLGEIVVDAVQSCVELARSGSAITIDARCTIGSWDRMRLEQIVSNLISNAAKYGAGRPIHVSVEGDDQYVTLTIRDRGVGLSTEAIATIFEPYSRVSSVKAATGLGLGLYITAQLVTAHGGTIQVDSVPGEGSTFVVELPRAISGLRRDQLPVDL